MQENVCCHYYDYIRAISAFPAGRAHSPKRKADFLEPVNHCQKSYLEEMFNIILHKFSMIGTLGR